MKTTVRAAAFAAATVTMTAATTNAAVTQPDGSQMPQPSADACCGATPETASLQALFDWRGENLDWFDDAADGPSTFSPLCSFTGTLVLRGGGCQLDFGWYNVDPSRSGPPADNEIYTLVPRTDPIFSVEFRPLVGDTGNVFTAADIRNDPNYAGGEIGFALRGNSGTFCTQTKFSEKELNEQCTSCSMPGAWITAIVYQSTRTPNAFYIAFEDLPNTSTSFSVPNAQYQNDGDFNDFVYFITGLVCEGGGEPCSTGQPGVCERGLTQCTSGGQTAECKPQTAPSAERCDLLDNDCNGAVDDGDGLCPPDFVCDNGSCVQACGRGEFRCPVGLECNTDGFCVDPLCVDVSCPTGEVCRAGDCVGPCDGVVCPAGQSCRFGRCSNPCDGVQCDTGYVCEEGICLSECGCRPCGAGKTCDPDSGKCVGESCGGMTCSAGTVCVDGACVDPCEGVVCPGGAECVDGACAEPDPDQNVAMGGAGEVTFGGTDGGAPPSGLVGDDEPGDGMGDGAGDGPQKTATDAGCGCRAVGTSGAPAPLGFAGLLLGLSALARRRRW